MVANVVVHPQIGIHQTRRSVSRLEVQRGKATRNSTICETRERVDRKELVAHAFLHGAAKSWIEEVLLRDRDIKQFVSRRCSAIRSGFGNQNPVGYPILELIRV